MPDDPRAPFRPVVRVDPPHEPEPGFTPATTSGLTDAELVALDAALRRLTATGLSLYEAKRALDAAVREWLDPRDAADAELDRLLAWR